MGSPAFRRSRQGGYCLRSLRERSYLIRLRRSRGATGPGSQREIWMGRAPRFLAAEPTGTLLGRTQRLGVPPLHELPLQPSEEACVRHAAEKRLLPP